MLNDIDKNTPGLAELIYGAYIGLDDLASKESADIGKPLEMLVEMINDHWKFLSKIVLISFSVL